jgi:hypothetical protein
MKKSPPRKRGRQLDLFGDDGAEGRKRRDEALVNVAANAETFMSKALKELVRFERGTYTGEDIRRQLELWGIRPHHHNAWGALVATAVRSRILWPTGRLAAMTDPRSHARKTLVYQIGGE